MINKRKLVLENGLVFYGIGFGSLKEVVAEIIYNNAVVGYQEIISDPSNCKKMICMTYPLIGNYGLTDEDYESKHIDITGLIVRDYNEQPSNFRYTRTLSEVLEENNISGITNIDTRKLMKIIRHQKKIKGLICDANKNIDDCLKIINNYQETTDLVSLVTSKKIWYSRTPNPMYNIVVYDLGTKLNYIRRLNQYGCNVIIVPASTNENTILNLNPDGIFITSGPGNPNNYNYIVDVIKNLIGVKPIFGVGLGFLLLARTYGFNIIEIEGGHHGNNYPVKNLLTGKIDITTQNHSYTIDKLDLENIKIQVLYQNIINNEIEGLIDYDKLVMGVQFEPLNPIDLNSDDLYKKFLNAINTGGNKNA